MHETLVFPAHCTLHPKQSILHCSEGPSNPPGHRSRLELGVAIAGTGWRLSSAAREGGVTGSGHTFHKKPEEETGGQTDRQIEGMNGETIRQESTERRRSKDGNDRQREKQRLECDWPMIWVLQAEASQTRSCKTVTADPAETQNRTDSAHLHCCVCRRMQF